jgi:hypothetical protein
MSDHPHMPSSAPSHAQKRLPSCDCDKDPIDGLKKLFVDYFQGAGLEAGRDPATRPVFLRLHGVAHGRFVILSDLREDLCVGVFSPGKSYPVWVRFSSDVHSGQPDRKGTVGIGIKLFGVGGEKLLAPEQNATTHDFILQNHDVFFVDTATDFCEFTYQSLISESAGDEYLKAHPTTAQILDEMKKDVLSVLESSYWSVLPFRFGANRYVKYKLVPGTTRTDVDCPPDFDNPFYLRFDLHRRMKEGEARFKFLLQFQTNNDEMPLDGATARWSEEQSQPIHVATLILPQQDLDMRNQSEYGENLAFNTWHALPEHEPVGSIAAARKVVYQASAEVRRNFNATPIGEPVEPRLAEWMPGVPYPIGKERTIVTAKIHPAIGIARVGNSESDCFIGPEIIDPEPAEPGFYRDDDGRLKRQAARFRIYGYDKYGNVVRELTADWADIQWSVHVANRKAAWYRWEMALDIPEAKGHELARRNANVTGEQRQGLVIDGGQRHVHGANKNGSAYVFRGKFQGTDVYLGEIRTDELGRLIFLGGHGISASPNNSPIFTSEPTFINADGWYDDISDGPVTAKVSIEGREVPVEGAWVLTAPPNYAPSLIGVRSLYDLLFDLYVKNGVMKFPETISFNKHVYPILHRLSQLQWTNAGFATQFGHGSPNDFGNEEYVKKLSTEMVGGTDPYKELRLQVLHSFRDPDGRDNNQLAWPWIYGDAMDVPPAATPRQNSAIGSTQYRILQEWAKGNFEADWDPTRTKSASVDQLKLADQPVMLDRAALEFCLADAFHPGCEMTWPIRHLSLFAGPFRILHRRANEPEPDYGPILTPEIAMSEGGPLHAQGPGDLTQWMGLPWQADTSFCRAGYHTAGYNYDPFVPAFWPARVPNNVLTRANYEVVVDSKQPRQRRIAAFTQRMKWAEYPLHDPEASTADQMTHMIEIYGDMGLIEELPGVPDDPDFPAKIKVASFGPNIGELPPPPELAEGERSAAAAPRKEPRLVRQWPLPVRHPHTRG